nr:hypothetical protein [Tanacetum cinerariifolium]
MKAYSKHNDWGHLKITKDIMEGDGMPKYGKTNQREDDSWTDIILDDVYDTFYRDEEQEIEVAKEIKEIALFIMKGDKGKGNEAEHDHLKVNKDDKGKGKVHDIQNRLGKLEVDLARALNAKQVDDHDDDFDTLDLEKRIKKLEEDFGRLLKAKKEKEAKKEELTAKEENKAKEEELKANEAKIAKEVELKANKAKEAMLTKLKAKNAKKAKKVNEAMLA